MFGFVFRVGYWCYFVKWLRQGTYEAPNLWLLLRGSEANYLEMSYIYAMSIIDSYLRFHFTYITAG
jgi:hypothetical protein